MNKKKSGEWPKFMTLDFFAKRMFTSVGNLQWGVIEKSADEGETYYMPIIIIKGNMDIFYILQDEFIKTPLLRTTQTIHTAKMRKGKNKVTFTAGGFMATPGQGELKFYPADKTFKVTFENDFLMRTYINKCIGLEW